MAPKVNAASRFSVETGNPVAIGNLRSGGASHDSHCRLQIAVLTSRP
jgi:carbamate kinase